MTVIETYRVAVFVSAEDVESVLASVRKVVNLQYGNYQGVSWASVPGQERYTPMKGANPTVGKIGVESVLPISRVEFSIPRDDDLLQRIMVEAIYPNHKWEEPVISVVPGFDVRRG